MSSIHRDDRPALIALALILAAIVLVALIEPNKHTPQGSKANENAAQVYADGEQARVTSSATVAGDEQFHWFGDSWAQWIMAGLAGVATALSIAGVGLLYITWKATEKTAVAAFAANDLARRQNDPFIFVSKVTLNPPTQAFPNAEKAHSVLLVTLKNGGLFPAFIERTELLLFSNIGGELRIGGVAEYDDVVAELQAGQSHKPIVFVLPVGQETSVVCAIVTFRTVTGAKRVRHFWMTKGAPKIRGAGWSVDTITKPDWVPDRIGKTSWVDRDN